MSATNGAHGTTGPAGGLDLCQKLEQLAAQLTEAVKEYKTALATGNDFIARQNVLKAAQAVTFTAKKPEEQWLDQSVMMAEMGAIRLFMKWKAFDVIPPPGHGSISYTNLAAKLDAQVSLVRRISWVLVSTGVLQQIGEDQIANTDKSAIYSNSDANGKLFQIMFDEGLIPYTKMPAYFEKYGRREAVTQNHNPHSFGHDQPDKFVWEIIGADPERMADFMQCMNTMEQHLPITGFYDFSWIAGTPADRVALVDVGGGKGQAIKAITAAYPGIPLTRTVLQDRPDVIAQVTASNDAALKGAQLLPHDFNTPQPVRNAAAYFIRRCLHDYSDEDCVLILKHLADAAGPDSKILICEQILTNPPPPLLAQTDFCMINIAGKERTADMFADLAARSGLKVESVSVAQGTPVGIVQCVKI